MNSINQILRMATICQFLILLFFPFQSQAKISDIKDPVSLRYQKIAVTSFLEDVSKQVKYHFIYDRNQIKQLEFKNVNFNHKPLGSVLQALSREYPLEFTLLPHSKIAVSTKKLEEPKKNQGKQQNGQLRGKVFNDQMVPMIGATLRIVETNQVSKSDEQGQYSFSLLPGKYTLEASFLAYQKKRYQNILIKVGLSSNLDVYLVEAKEGLEEIKVVANIRKASVEGHYLRQKNEAGISNGLSAEQIANLPDKNIGEALKRISGISTNDNKRVVVRGIAERYNLAMMDGATLPSTDVQVRDFEFDIIPSNLIDNVIVSKTSTPDLSFGFGGGLVQINTMAIPQQNFNNLSLGGKYVNGSTNKEFLGFGRGKFDFLGFDDGKRNHFPDDILIFDNSNFQPNDPNFIPLPGVTKITEDMIRENNRKIGGFERMGTRRYNTLPGGNLQFSLGRTYDFNNSKFGFASSLTYRNEQQIDYISAYNRGEWQTLGNKTINTATGESNKTNSLDQYNFQVNWGLLVNLGWQSKNHKIESRNFYSRVFSNQFSSLVAFENREGNTTDLGPHIKEFDRPKYIDLIQNRLNGEHQIGKFTWEWNVTRNNIVNLELDAIDVLNLPYQIGNDTLYSVVPEALTNPGGGDNFGRSKYRYEEKNQMLESSLSYQFNAFGLIQKTKVGFQYLDRHGTYFWTVLPIGTVSGTLGGLGQLPVQKWSSLLEFEDRKYDLMYYPAAFSKNGYEGKNTNIGYYAMLDNKITPWARLVWGLRSEYYNYKRILNSSNDLLISHQILDGEKRKYVDPTTGQLVTATADATSEEKTWRFLPSANLTITAIDKVNFRFAYAKTAIRPALIENSQMIRYDPSIGAYRKNEGVLTTVIDHLDFRTEWYPNPGEVISFGLFYKYFDKPVELYNTQFDSSMRTYVQTMNSEWAKIKGLELDIRKNFTFLNPNWLFLDNLYFNGNLTLQKSEVQGANYASKSMGHGVDKDGNEYAYRTKQLLTEKRPLYGQVPLTLNLGLQYDGNRLGVNLAYNYMGYKTFATGLVPEIVELERPRGQLDAQISYNLLKDKKMKVRFNVSNLTNAPYRFYINKNETYKIQDKWFGYSISEIYDQTNSWGDIYEWKYGFSQKYDKGYYQLSEDGKTRSLIGDLDTYVRRVGSSFSVSLNYNF